jgi:hypothetical protein
MKLFASCSKCKNEISFKSKHRTRVEFAKHNGKTTTLTCKSCGQNNTFKLDEIFAKKSKNALIAASLIFFTGIPFVIYYVYEFVLKIGGLYSILTIGGFLLIPIFVYKLISFNEKVRVNTFNKEKSN